MSAFAFESPNPAEVAEVVDGTGLITDDPNERAYAREMARRTLASGAELFIGMAPEGDVGMVVEVDGSRVKIAPLAMMLASLFLYGLIVLLILLFTLLGTSNVQYITLASSHFTDPFATVQALYSSPEEREDVARSWEENPARRFGVEVEEDRFWIGVLEAEEEGEEEEGRGGEREKGRAFGVRKGGLSGLYRLVRND